MRDNLHPKTPLQQTLFDQIVSTRWRLDRLAEAQSHLFSTELQKLDPQRHAAVKRQRNCGISSSELLAHRFSDDKNNGFILMERYERGLTNTLLRLQRAFDKEQKLRPTVDSLLSPDQLSPPREEPAWSPTKARAQSIAFARARQNGRDLPIPDDYPQPGESLEHLEQQLLKSITKDSSTPSPEPSDPRSEIPDPKSEISTPPSELSTPPPSPLASCPLPHASRISNPPQPTPDPRFHPRHPRFPLHKTHHTNPTSLVVATIP